MRDSRPAGQPTIDRRDAARSKTMKKMLKSVTVAAAMGVMVLAATTARAQEKDIVDTAVAAGSFKTLAAALTAGDLVQTLKGKGPFTVFAPTDEAFAKLPAGTLADLLKPENKAKLVSILTYHVVPGKVMASQVTGLKSAKTVNGQSVTIAVMDGKVMIDKAQVVTTDIAASNGVIHVLDTVLLPAAK
jgi:transforming growth factor-beta-induced protein